MKKTVVFSGRQKAMIGSLCKQFDENRAKPCFEYNLVRGQDHLIGTGDAEKYRIYNPAVQVEILKELAAMNIGIGIHFVDNKLDVERNCVIDELHSNIILTDDSDEDTMEMFQARLSFGTICIDSPSEEIRKLRATLKEYTGIFKLLDGIDYSVTIYDGDQKIKTLHYSRLHAGSRPQIILCHAVKHEGDSFKKDELNAFLKIKKAKTYIGEEEYVTSVVYGRTRALKDVLPYFFDIQVDSVEYRGSINNHLSYLDLEILEKHSKKA